MWVTHPLVMISSFTSPEYNPLCGKLMFHMTSLCVQQDRQASAGLVSGLEGQSGCSETWTS